MRLASVFSLHSYYEYEHGKHITFEVDDIKINLIFYTLQIYLKNWITNVALFQVCDGKIYISNLNIDIGYSRLY